MALEESYSPQPMGLPPCWTIGKHLGPFTIIYDGPSLVDSVMTLSFTGGLAPLTASYVEDFSVEFPNRHIITIPRFVPTEPNDGTLEVKYKFAILYSNGEDFPLHYGTWPLDKLAL